MQNRLFETFRNKNEGIIRDADIKTILKHMSFDSWFIVDLDDTTFEAVEDLGSTAWYDELEKRAKALFQCTDLEASVMATILDNEVKSYTHMQPVQPKIVLMIKALQAIGIPVLGLTARDKRLIRITTRQLDEINIKFDRSKDLYGMRGHALTVPNPVSEVFFYRGIIFCDENNKGECLKAFFDYYHFKPAHIAFADDRIKHLVRVRNAVKTPTNYFFGLHYTNTKHKTSHPFDFQNALVQLARIRPFLSDDAKQSIIKLKLL